MTKINTQPTLDVGDLVSLNIPMKVAVGDLIEIINTAYEEGVIDYWECEYSHAKHAKIEINGTTHNYTYKFEIEVDDKKFTIDVDVIKRGIERILNGDVHVATRIQNDLRDAIAGSELPAVDTDAVDVIIQAGLFNDIVFG
jgi:hypothetical protein